MATGNSATLVFILFGVHLLLCCCPANSQEKGSNSDEGTTVTGDESSSRNARQLLMPAIYPYTAGLLTNYPQRPPNFFDQWLHAPSNISTVSSDGKLFDETLPSARQQQRYPCGRGPAKPPQRATVGIIGGSEAVPNSWPFIVLLRKNGVASCGGSLISPDKILTAAHCVEKLTSYEISRMTVSLGMHTVGDGKETENDAQVTRRVSKVVMHNAYSVINEIPLGGHDIAILTLESPVVYSDVISPVCLDIPSNDPDQYAGKDVTIIGWGRTKWDEGMSDTLQQVTTQGILSLFCKNSMKVKNTDYVFCVYGMKTGTCSGDSGGPLVVQSATGAWTQVGIVSFGNSKCSGPSVSTRVSAYKSWIINNM